MDGWVVGLSYTGFFFPCSFSFASSFYVLEVELLSDVDIYEMHGLPLKET